MNDAHLVPARRIRGQLLGKQAQSLSTQGTRTKSDDDDDDDDGDNSTSTRLEEICRIILSYSK